MRVARAPLRSAWMLHVSMTRPFNLYVHVDRISIATVEIFTKDKKLIIKKSVTLQILWPQIPDNHQRPLIFLTSFYSSF